MKTTIKKLPKSAVNGRIVSVATLKKNPKTTYLQTVSVPSKIKKVKPSKKS